MSICSAAAAAAAVADASVAPAKASRAQQKEQQQQDEHVTVEQLSTAASTRGFLGPYGPQTSHSDSTQRSARPVATAHVFHASRASLALGQSFERRMRIADLRREQMLLQSAAYQSSFAAAAAAGERERQRDDLAAFSLVARILRAEMSLPACNPCDKGYYSSIDNSTSCTACPPGKTTAGTGSTSSSACFSVSDVASTATAFLRITSSAAYLVDRSTTTRYSMMAYSVSTPLVLNASATPPNVQLNNRNSLTTTLAPDSLSYVSSLARMFKTAYTVNIWAKPTSFNLYNREVDLFGIGYAAQYRGLGLKIWAENSNVVFLNTWYNSDFTIRDKLPLGLSDPKQPDPSKYHMFTVSWSSANPYMNIYFDGTLLDSLYRPSTMNPPNFDTAPNTWSYIRLFIGSYINTLTSATDNDSTTLINYIAGFRAWTSQLTNQQILDLYNQGPM